MKQKSKLIKKNFISEITAMGYGFDDLFTIVCHVHTRERYSTIQRVRTYTPRYIRTSVRVYRYPHNEWYIDDRQ